MVLFRFGPSGRSEGPAGAGQTEGEVTMWEYLANHPWWGLTYLVVICFTAFLISMAIGSAIHRKNTVLTWSGKNDDVVH